jgi:catecholate siderophore receptor
MQATLRAGVLAALLAPLDQAVAEEPEVIEIIGDASRYDIDSTSTATKTETPLLEVPQSLTVVTRGLIDNQAMRSMADLVLYVPGVQMGQGEGHRDAPTLRGNSTTADFFVDGVRDDVQYYRDLYNAERVEVLKGPNAMIFGRGGGGGIINRVTEQADQEAHREVSLRYGEEDERRVAADFGDGVTDALALRLNAMYEDSDSYRRFVNVERLGINPTATYEVSDATRILMGYEHFDDSRTVDRGLPSFEGSPVDVDSSVFFGNPDVSFADATVDLANVTLEHDLGGGGTLRNHTVYGDYDKFYQNVFASGATENEATISAYNNATERRNWFNQTDLVWDATTGSIGHTLLAGMELGQQDTTNFRSTGYFDPVLDVTSLVVPLADPVTFDPVFFRQSATDADNESEATVAALYVQDQLELSPAFMAVLGLRFDQFDVEVHDRRSGNTFSRDDDLVSPRLGLIYKTGARTALYASYSVSYLPSSGDQFASLDATSAALEPEEFENVEVGVKWDALPNLAFTAALYQLDRTNTRAPGPDPGTIVLTGSQRSEGIELGLSGSITERWQIAAGWAFQDAEITSTTTSATEGQDVPLVPEQAFSLWNRYQFTQAFGAGLGVIHQDDRFASISNAVTLPSFTRVDAALFFDLNDSLSAQINAENIFDEDYFSTAHNDNNITPGAPRLLRATLTARF